MSDPEIEIIRSQASRRGAGVWLAASALAAFTALFVLRAEGGQRAANAAIAAVAFLLVIAAQQLSMRFTRLELHAGTLTFRGLFRRRILSAPDAPARVVRVEVADVARADGQIWFGPDDTAMLMTSAWGEERLGELAHRLDLSVTHDPDKATLPELAKRYPGVVPWFGAHPVVTGVVAFAVLIAVILPVAL